MTPSLPPVRRHVVVDLDVDSAFRLFTEGHDRWWPRSHHIGQAAMRQAVLEPRPGGRWYEIGEDGAEADWGRVLAWEPPHRLVLAWQIAPDHRHDPDLGTEVEVRFAADGAGRARLDLEHRDLERFGEAAERFRGMLDGGWGDALGHYVAAAGT